MGAGVWGEALNLKSKYRYKIETDWPKNPAVLRLTGLFPVSPAECIYCLAYTTFILM